MKQVNLTLVTGMPIDRAASMNPPVALIQLPKFVLDMIAEASRTSATNQRNEARKRPPPMKSVNKAIGTLSTASKGGNPPDITMVSERTMKSIPRVVMKLGISNLSVMNALRKPMMAQIKIPTANAGQNGTPAFSMRAMLIGMIAKTDPTERSTSPH